MNDTHSQNSQAPNSALSKQIGQVGCKAVVTIQRISPRGDQRTGKRSAARRTTCASTVSFKRSTWNRATVVVRTEPHSLLQGRTRSWQPLRSIGLLFQCQRPPSGSVRRLGARGACAPCHRVLVRGQRRPWWLPQRKPIHGLSVHFGL